MSALEATRGMERTRLRSRSAGLRSHAPERPRPARLRGVDRARDDGRVGRRGAAGRGIATRSSRSSRCCELPDVSREPPAAVVLRPRPRRDAARVSRPLHGDPARDDRRAAPRRRVHGERDAGGDDRQHQRLRQARLPLPALDGDVPPAHRGGPTRVRVTFLGHACHLVEVDGLRILTDPWLVDPIFDGRCEHDPPLAFGPDDLPPHRRDRAHARPSRSLQRADAGGAARQVDSRRPSADPLHRAGREPAASRLRRICTRGATSSRFGLGDGAHRAHAFAGRARRVRLADRGPRADRFWNGADAPQPPEVVARDRGALRPHRSRRLQPQLVRSAGAAAPALVQGCRSRSRGRRAQRRELLGARRGLRRRRPTCAGVAPQRRRDHAQGDPARPAHFAAALEARRPRRTLRSTCAPGTPGRARAASSAACCTARRRRACRPRLHPRLPRRPALRWSPPGEPSTEQTFRRDLPRLLAAAAGRLALRGAADVRRDRRATIPGGYTVDFRRPGEEPVKGDTGAPFALRLPDGTGRASLRAHASRGRRCWSPTGSQVTRVRRGAPPDGLHFVYALQAVFP